MAEPIIFSGGNEATSHFEREAAKSGQILACYSKQEQYLLKLNMLFENRIICPPFMDSNSDFIELHKGRLNEYQPEKIHDIAHNLRDYTQNLLTGCRGYNVD